MKKAVQIFLLISIIIQANAQQNDTLFSIKGKPVLLDEFKSLFLNNTEEGQTYTAREYLDLFINYKLKIREAIALKYDTLPTFKNEYEGYRKQLISSFTKNPETEERLTKEAYDRSLEEIRAKNILITLPRDASPQDTLKTYNRLKEAYAKLQKGADFDQIAMEYSEPKIADNQIDLGFFTVFQMVYPFETTAYKTKVGEVSKPFRSRYGFHLLQVTDRRPANGKITVKHIQLVPAENDSVYQLKSELIQKIYGELQAGAVFDSLAKKYSEDKSTASAGGVLRPFGIGTLQTKVFEEEAFALKEGGFSKPFQTPFGWHIVQLIHREPVASFENQKPALEMNVRRDERSELIENARLEWLKSTYKTKIFKTVQLAVKKWLDENIQPDVVLQEKAIFQIEDKEYSAKDFFEQLKKSNNLPFDKVFTNYFKNQLEQYHEAHLEQHNAEFRSIVQKYHDGLLVYSIMENEVWKKSQQDTIGLQRFYEKNQSKYLPSKVNGYFIAENNKISVLEKVLKYYQNSEISGVSDLEESKKLFKKVNFATVSEDELRKKVKHLGQDSPKFSEGKIIPIEDSKFALIKFVELPDENLKFNSSDPKLFNDYQEFVEKNWLKELFVKYEIEINPAAIQTIEAIIK
jgi:peptidyl-prolyl cis-trans isomerase SurA